MDALVTMIGNAVVDASFRKMFLKDPVDTMDKYEFRLTKGDFEMLWAAFGELKKDEKENLEKLFKALEDALYQQLDKTTKNPCRPCRWSLCPPKNLRPPGFPKAA